MAVAKKTATRQTRSSQKTDYIQKEDMMKEITRSKQLGHITEELGKMFLMLARRYGSVKRFVGYSYNDDLQSFALLTLCKVWKSFDETKYNNPFAYYTQVIHNAFFQFDNLERKQRDIRDQLLVKQGRPPSFNYADRLNSEEHDADGDKDYMEMYNDSAVVLKSETVFDEDDEKVKDISDVEKAFGELIVPEETTELEIKKDDDEEETP